MVEKPDWAAVCNECRNMPVEQRGGAINGKAVGSNDPAGLATSESRETGDEADGGGLGFRRVAELVCACGGKLRPRGTDCWKCYRKRKAQ